MRLPGWIVQVWSPRTHKPRTLRQRVRTDLVWWACLVGVTLLVMLPLRTGYSWWDPVAVVAGYGAALLLREFVPIAAFLVTVTLATWAATFMESSDAPWPFFATVSVALIAYLVGRADSGDHGLLTQILAMLIVVALLIPVLRIPLLEVGGLSAYLVFTLVFPWLIGRYRHQHSELISAGWNRAEQLEREQRAVADQARLRERTRIAEDMHDSLGHELSLIALRAAALEVDAELPRRHQEAAGELRRSAAVATERLREIIGLLRDDRAASVTPVDETVTDLVERGRDSGADIVLTVTGSAQDMSRMSDRAVYRVVQESLTNAAKHAPGRAVTIQIDHTEPGFTTVDVVNDLPERPVTDAVSGGRGLVGLAERVRLAGGVLASGTEAGQFRVHARLPDAAEELVVADSQTDTESAQRHVRARVLTRRRLIVAFALPAALLVVLGMLSMGLIFITSLNSVLEPGEYNDLRVGQQQDAAEDVLPMFEMIDPPDWVGLPPGVPANASCLYYSRTAEYDGIGDAYQVCFADGRLVSKTVITEQERRQHLEDRYGG